MDTCSAPEHTTTVSSHTEDIELHSGELALAALVESLAALRVNASDADIDALIECIGQLNLAGADSCGGTAFDMHVLLDALPVAIASDDDLTELVIRWLDGTMNAAGDCEEQDNDDLSSVDGYDDLPTVNTRSHIPADIAIAQLPMCVDPKKIFPPPPLEMDWSESDSDETASECGTPSDSDDESVATASSKATISCHRFNLKRSYDESDLESSDSDDEYVVKRRRCVALPRRVRQPRRKCIRFMSVLESSSSSDANSSEESYFSDTIHAARPMSPIDGEIANNLATHCNLNLV